MANNGISANVTQAAPSISGSSQELPLIYRDGSWCGFMYLVDLARAEALCAGSEVEPWPMFGRALAAIYAWEYRETSIGPYNEVGIGIQARRRGTKPSFAKLAIDMSAQDDQGIFVLSLPVTTQIACSAGIELWGYPKYVTSIETRFDQHSAHVQLGSELELNLRGVRGVMKNLPIITYTKLGADLVRTAVEVGCSPRVGLPVGASVRVTGDGPSAHAVRALGVDEHRPVAAFHTPAFRAALPLGRALKG
jgi:hypothetical protein